MKTFRPLICLSSVQKSIIKYLKKRQKPCPEKIHPDIWNPMKNVNDWLQDIDG